MTSIDRHGLLNQLKQRKSDTAAREPAAPRSPYAQHTDFSTLPAVKEMAMQRKGAEMLGLTSPFFREQEGMAGARCRIGGRDLLNFSNYNYLGLANHPRVRDAVMAAYDRYGPSAGASRMVAGERPIHRELERALAGHYGTEDCAVFVSGFVTNVTAIGHLMGEQDLILTDALIHNSILQGATLSGATRRSFAHNDLDALDSLLKKSRAQFKRVLIVVEGVYSMDGDLPDLPRLIALKQQYGCWLMVDEAHALGVTGARGYGSHERFSIDPRDVDLWMGTLSKTLCACGGYIAGNAVLIDYLKHMSPGFVYSVGLSPLLAAAAKECLSLLHEEPERVAALQNNSRHALDKARALGLDTGSAMGTCVMPVILGDSIKAVRLSEQLFEHGINVLPIIPPAVEPKAARLRFFLSADHTADEIDRALDTAARLARAL